jgi:predicted DNA-binding transcriptional regulator AlpA
MALKFLSRKEVAERLGVKTDSINGYPLPEPDALIGTHRGWLPDTIDQWSAERPGRGNWGDRKDG